MADKRIPLGKSADERYEAFADAYVTHNLNATAAATAVGYSPKTAREQASRLLSKAHIQELIRVRLAPRLDRLSVDADKVLHEVAKLAFSNIADFIKVDPITGAAEINFPSPDDEDFLTKMAAVEGLEQDTVGGADGGVVRTKFKLASKQAALSTLAKILGMLKDQVEHSGANGGPIPVRFDFGDLDQADRDALRGILDRQRQKALDKEIEGTA